MTTYYIDSDNGNNGNAGTSTGAAWATLDQFTENARSAGDIAILRNSMTARYDDGTDLNFTSDGAINNPIIITRDYNNAFGDDVDLSATATAAFTFGSKTVTFASDISGVLAAGDWIYNADDDDPEEFAYEVASVVTTTVTLYLPFKGTAGSGKAATNIGSPPIWNTAAGNLQVNFDTDDAWEVRGVHFRGTDGQGVVEIDSCHAHVFHDCIFEGNGSNDSGFLSGDDGPNPIIRKSRIYNVQYGALTGGAGGWEPIRFVDCLINTNDVTNSTVMLSIRHSVIELEDTEVVNIGGRNFQGSHEYGRSFSVFARNTILDTGNTIILESAETDARSSAVFEDYNGTVGDTRQFLPHADSDGDLHVQSDTTTVRSGGSDLSVKVTPHSQLGDPTGNWSPGRILLFEHPIYATTSSKQYDIYFRPTATSDWTADPTAAQLWIEAGFWGHASNNYRRIVKSTGTIDMNGSTDWQALSVTVAPAQEGVLYLRGWYAKAKESGKANTFFVDPIPVVT